MKITTDRKCLTCGVSLGPNAHPRRLRCEPCAVEAKKESTRISQARHKSDEATWATKCAHCGAVIPKVRRSATTKYCKRQCAQAARRDEVVAEGKCGMCHAPREDLNYRTCAACRERAARSRAAAPKRKRKPRKRVRVIQEAPVGRESGGADSISSPRARWKTHTRDEIESWITVKPTEPRLAGLGYWGSIGKMFEVMPDMRELMPGLYADWLEYEEGQAGA